MKKNLIIMKKKGHMGLEQGDLRGKGRYIQCGTDGVGACHEMAMRGPGWTAVYPRAER